MLFFSGPYFSELKISSFPLSPVPTVPELFQSCHFLSCFFLNVILEDPQSDTQGVGVGEEEGEPFQVDPWEPVEVIEPLALVGAEGVVQPFFEELVCVLLCIPDDLD